MNVLNNSKKKCVLYKAVSTNQVQQTLSRSTKNWWGAWPNDKQLNF